jgi:hypothetical protein
VAGPAWDHCAVTATATLRAPARLPGVVAALFWIALPVLCVLMLWQGANQLATRIHHVPSGVRGNFVVTTHNCQQKLCITGGTFTSDDKKLVAKDLLGVYAWKRGTTHRVVYNVDAADVIPLPAQWDPTSAVLGITGGTVLLGVWAWFLRGEIRRARSRGRARPVDPVD